MLFGRFVFHTFHIPKQNVPLLCIFGQNPHEYWPDLSIETSIILRLDDDAFSGEKLLRIKQNYILKKFHLQLIRERILTCIVIGLMTVSTYGP